MNIRFDKYADGLVPAVVQHAHTDQVLMVGFMNAEALERTRNTKRVTFYSRSRQQLWVKGGVSGNYLDLDDIIVDCDADTLLIKARPSGPVCHTGLSTCFGEAKNHAAILFELEKVIAERRSCPTADSYTARLLSEGINRIAQKVGEEAIELVIEAKDDDPAAFRAEAADLLFHLLVLLNAKGMTVNDVFSELASRRRG